MKKNFFLGLCLLLLSQACYKDKGNYDYTPPQNINITIPQGTLLFDIPVGEVYQITPKIEMENPADSVHLAYVWLLDKDTISTEKNLKHIFPDLFASKNMLFQVRDNRTGFSYNVDFKIGVVSHLSKGWLILAEGETQSSRLHFVKPVKAVGEIPRHYDSYPDLYASFFPEDPLGTKPIGLEQTFSKESSIVLVKQESPSYWLNGDGYHKDLPLASEFVGRELPEGFVPKQIAFQYFFDAIIGQDGKLYSRLVSSGSLFDRLYPSQYSRVPMKFEGAEIKAEQVMKDGGGVFIYEKEKKRMIFVYGGSNASNGRMTVNAGYTTDPNCIPFDNFGDYELVYMDRCMPLSGIMANFFFLFKKGEELHMQYHYITIGSLRFRFTSGKTGVFPGSGLVSADAIFKICPRRTYIFFAENSKIWFYDFKTEKTTEYYDFGEGKIIDMDFNPQQSELGIGFEDGKFVIMNIQDQNLFNPTILFETSGYGKIKDVMYKYSNFNDWYSLSGD